MVATIMEMQPPILQTRFHNSFIFHVSNTYVQKWMYDALLWSRRKATRAAHKLPECWEAICEQSLLWKAFSIKEHNIPPGLLVNSDQTQVVYAPGDGMTYAETGSKQINSTDVDEKRVITVMVSVACDGFLLPFQAIYQGMTDRSCPSISAPLYDEAKTLGFVFEASMSKTYWSNQKTMCTSINEILAPYYARRKHELGLPEGQKSLWNIDVWSVHWSEEFWGWMKKIHPNIIMDFVPGGCTGVFQPCDVGMQRPMKLSIKKSYHEEVVKEVLGQVKWNQLCVILSKEIATHRNRSVRWLVNTYHILNNPWLVKKVSFMKAMLTNSDLDF